MRTARFQQVLMRIAAHDVDTATALLDAVQQRTLARHPPTHVALGHRQRCFVIDEITQVALLLRTLPLLLLLVVVLLQVVLWELGRCLFGRRFDVVTVTVER